MAKAMGDACIRVGERWVRIGTVVKGDKGLSIAVDAHAMNPVFSRTAENGAIWVTIFNRDEQSSRGGSSGGSSGGGQKSREPADADDDVAF